MTQVVDLPQLSNLVIKPGDTVLLKDGSYANLAINLSCNGTASAPIIIKAQNPGKVILTGTSTLSLTGSYTIVANLVFKNGGVNKCINILGNNNRLTGCDVAYTACDVDFLVRIQNKNNRVDHCVFHDFNKLGVWVVVWRPDASENYAMIDHNIFRNRINSSGAANGLESIRIGASDQSLSSSNTIVAWNLLDNCNGEIEAISNKSCDNVFYKNTYSNCEGTLTLRHGDRCIVHRNKFLQNKKPNSGGVRVTGESHIVSQNLFKDINGNGTTRAGVSINNGMVDTLINGYYTPKNCKITDNTFINCSDDFAIGVQVKSTCTLKPESLLVSGNTVYKTSQDEVFSSDSSVLGVTSATFTNNALYATKLGKPPMQGFTLLQPTAFLGINEAEYGVNEPIGPTWGQLEPEATALPGSVQDYYVSLKALIASDLPKPVVVPPVVAPPVVVPPIVVPPVVAPPIVVPPVVVPPVVAPPIVVPPVVKPPIVAPPVVAPPVVPPVVVPPVVVPPVVVPPVVAPPVVAPPIVAPPTYTGVIEVLNGLIKTPTKDTTLLTQAMNDIQSLVKLFPKNAKDLKTASDSIKSAITKPGTASATKLLVKSVDKLKTLV
jgi:hypothetical protein